MTKAPALPGRWTVAAIPDQRGRTIVVTGANGGLGHVTARELARRGAHVVLTARDPDKGESAPVRLRANRRTPPANRDSWTWPTRTRSTASPTVSTPPSTHW